MSFSPEILDFFLEILVFSLEILGTSVKHNLFLGIDFPKLIVFLCFNSIFS